MLPGRRVDVNDGLMKYATIFYLTVAAACLGLLLWLVEQRDREQRATDDLPSKLFPEYNPARIERLRIEHEDWILEVEQRDRDWQIVHPFRGRADAARIHNILAYVDRLPIREKLTREQREARGLLMRHFGLDAPHTRLTLADTDREYSIWVGVESPLQDGLYIQAAAMPHILLTDRRFSDVLPQTKDDLRERSLVTGMPADIFRLDIRPYGGTYVQLVRDQQGDWMLRQPMAARADREAIHKRLERLFDARAKQFLPERTSALLADYGLEDGEATVQVSVWGTTMDHGEDVFLGKPVDADPDLVYARRGDGTSVFTVPRHILDAFLVEPDALRDKRLFRIEPWDVTGFELRDREDSVTLRRKDYHWKVVRPVQWNADYAKALEMVVQACELRVLQIVDDPCTNLAELGLSPARYELTLWGEPDQATNALLRTPESAKQVQIGARTEDGKAYYARGHDEDFIFTLAADQLDGLLIGTNQAGLAFTDPLIYHGRSVLAVDPATVKRIEIQRGETHQIVERDPEGKWIAEKPESRPLNLEQIETVLALVEELQALRVEHRGIDQPAVFGFDRPGLKLTLELSGAGALSKTLVSGFRARTDGIFTMIQGRDLVFAVSRDIINRLSHDLMLPLPD